MSVDFLYFNWWTEGDDIYVRHLCDDTVIEWKAPPPWRLDGNGGITPSFDCQACGAHSILRECDRLDRVANPIPAPVVPADSEGE